MGEHIPSYLMKLSCSTAKACLQEKNSVLDNLWSFIPLYKSSNMSLQQLIAFYK